MSYADKPLSVRDWLLLPGVSLLTVIAMAAVVEPVCRLEWPVNENDTCSTATGNLPNCVVRMKNVEGPEYEYRFNECGYRSATSCGKKPDGAVRLVSMGTSIGMGLWVPAKDLFANRAGKELAAILHRPVDVQNMGSLSVTIRDMAGEIPDAMALNPDAIVIELCPFDLPVLDGFGTQPVPSPAATHESGGLQHTLMNLRLLVRQSRFGYMAQHMLLSDDGFLYRTYADFGDPDDVLRQPSSPACTRHYAYLAQLFGDIRKQLKGADVPIFILPIPNRVAAGMMSDGVEIPNCDPRAFERRVDELAAAHGLLVANTDAYFTATPHAERLYYTVDSHPGPGAHILLGHALATRLAEYFRAANGGEPDRVRESLAQ